MSKFITAITCIAIFYNIFTPFRLILDGGKSIVSIIAFVVLFLFGNLLKSRIIWITLIYTLIVALLIYLGVEYFQDYLWIIVTILFSAAVIEYYAQTKSIYYAKWVVLTTYGSLLLLVLISIPQFILIPNLSRLVNSEINTGVDLNLGSLTYWSVSWESIHQLPLLAIPAVVWLRSTDNNKYKALCYFVLISFVVLLLFADATIPLIFTIFSILTVVIYNEKKKFAYNLTRMLFILGVCTIIFNKGTIVYMLETVQPIFTGSSNEAKVSEIVSYINYGEKEGDLSLRDEMYDITFKSLKNNLFGIEKSINHIGKHSFILDHLAAMGLFLFMFFLFYLYSIYKRGTSVLHRNRYAFGIAFAFFIIVGLLKNFFLINSLLAIVPLSLVLSEKEKTLSSKKYGKKSIF